MENVSEGSVIALPCKWWQFRKKWRLRRRLEKKFREYLGRAAISMETEEDTMYAADALHKARVLGTLLKTGRVDADELKKELSETMPFFNEALFERACVAILLHTLRK